MQHRRYDIKDIHMESHHSSKSRSCAKKRAGRKAAKSSKKRINPGPLTNNPYLNYIRYYRKNSNSTDQKAQVSAAARNWRKMDDDAKCRFKRQAKIVQCAERRNRLIGFHKRR